MAKKRRTNAKHPGLQKQYNSRVKQEYLDQDYVGDLSDKEKDWLNDFNEEYYGANLDFQNLKNNRFHRTKKDKKNCTDRNNARNRCLYGIKKAGGKIEQPNSANKNFSESPSDKRANPKTEPASDNPEDALIDYIDSKITSENEQ